MLLEEFGANDEICDDELVIWPEVAFIEENPATRFMNQARRPWLGSPGSVELSLQEESELVRIRDRKNLNVAPFFPRLEAVGPQPGSQRHVLRISLLRRRYFLAVKIRSFL